MKIHSDPGSEETRGRSTSIWRVSLVGDGRTLEELFRTANKAGETRTGNPSERDEQLPCCH
jgi:hypothetical protein